MTDLKVSSQIELLDGTVVTITEIKENITFEKIENGQPVSQSISLSDFKLLVKISEKEAAVGLKFLDQDKAQAEILEISGNKIFYKKQYGADSWNNSITTEEFRDKQRDNLITIL